MVAGRRGGWRKISGFVEVHDTSTLARDVVVGFVVELAVDGDQHAGLRVEAGIPSETRSACNCPSVASWVADQERRWTRRTAPSPC